MSRLAGVATRPSARGGAVPLGLAALAGVLYGIALAPDASAALAWLALVPFFVACGRARPALAGLCGVVFAAVATALLSPWFPGMLERFFGVSSTGAWLGWLGLVLLVNAPAYAALGAWIAWSGRSAPLVLGAAWLVAEWLRAHGPVPNPYALLATSQLGTPLAQSADLVGAFGVGAAVATGSAVLAVLADPRRRGPRTLRDSLLALGVLGALFAYGSWRGALSYADGPALAVALVQPGEAAGPDAGKSARALERLLALTEQAHAAGPRLVFWPESAVGFYLREEGRDRERVLASTRAPGTELVLGGPHYRYAQPSPDYFASVFLLRGGHVAGRYDKQRLVPFAEYAPLGARGGAEDAALRPGERARTLETSAGSVGAFLCGEVLFPEVARALARAGATILANPSNDAWFGAEAPARHQLRAAALRAIENRRPLVRATTNGYSAVLDAHGATVVSSARAVPALLEARIEPSAATTPYQRIGAALAPCALGVSLAASLPRWRRRDSGGSRS